MQISININDQGVLQNYSFDSYIKVVPRVGVDELHPSDVAELAINESSRVRISVPVLNNDVISDFSLAEFDLAYPIKVPEHYSLVCELPSKKLLMASAMSAWFKLKNIELPFSVDELMEKEDELTVVLSLLERGSLSSEKMKQMIKMIFASVPWDISLDN